MLRWGIALGLPLNLLYLAPGGLFELPVRYLFTPILPLGYVGLIALLVEGADPYRRRGERPRLLYLA
jgi:uncharacterized protein